MSLDLEEMKLVGGSDVAAIAGIHPYKGPLAVYMRVVEGVVEETASVHASRGNRLEGPVLDWYAEEHQRTVQRKVSLRDARRPHLRASVDALSWGVEGSLARVVEAKTANGEVAHRWGEAGTDIIPAEYLCQVQWYMGRGRETGFAPDDVADVPALVAGDFRLYRVAFDAEAYGLLYESVERFWVDHVLASKPPEPTSLAGDAAAVQRRFRRHEREEQSGFDTLAPEAKVALEEYLRAYQDESAAAERLALWETRLKLLLGGAPGVRDLPEETGFRRIDWRQNKPGKRTDWHAVVEEAAASITGAAALRSIIERHTTTTEGARPFVPRPLKRGTR